MNVIVTGGTGFVGTWMQKTQPEGVNAACLSRANYSEALESMECDAIVHLANISPTLAIEQTKRNNARLLYCSSGIVYYPENNIQYRQNKIEWEAECLQSGADVVIARLFTFRGNGLDDNKAIVQFERAAKANKPLHIWGDGSTIRSYMHGIQLGVLMWAILQNGKRGEAYDVGSDTPITMLELANRIVAENNSKSKIIVDGGKDAMPIYLPKDTAKTKKLLKINKNGA